MTITTLRVVRTVTITTCLALVALARFLWAHRIEIAAAIVLAAELTYEAGCWTRRTFDSVAARSVELLPAQPLPALAPISANLQALRDALARLVARLYPAPVKA